MTELLNQRLAELLNGMSKSRIVIYGDVMLDEFVWGDVTRISPEAPVPVVDISRESIRLGGAANVLANVIALGGAAEVVGVMGRDRAGERLCAELTRVGARDAGENCIVDETRPTTLKTRIIAHNQLVVRADRETRTPVSSDIENKIIARLEKSLMRADAFIVSDYDKGAVTPAVLNRVLAFAHERNVPTLIDPKARNFRHYHPATLITPNHHEALKFTNTEDATDDGIAHAARLMRRQLACHAVLVTRGEHGMMLLEEDDEPSFVRTVAREVYDVTGAGDTVIATLGLSLACEATLREAAILANHAAGIVVGKVGTATATSDELRRSFENSTS